MINHLSLHSSSGRSHPLVRRNYGVIPAIILQFCYKNDEWSPATKRSVLTFYTDLKHQKRRIKYVIHGAVAEERKLRFETASPAQYILRRTCFPL